MNLIINSNLLLFCLGDYPTWTRPSTACSVNEATCMNGQCIPKSSLCNGHNDCADGSDESSCTDNGRCQPNEFKCSNNKCVLKTWRCGE